MATQYGPRNTVFEWAIIQVAQQKVDYDGVAKTFEKARRAPGVRIIYHDEPNQKILLTKEYRKELQTYDYRLPGWKLVDTLTEFLKLENEATQHENKEEILSAYAAKACIKEWKEETGLKPIISRRLGVSQAGATIERDLYYFVCTDREWGEQQQEVGEDIEVCRFGYDEVIYMLQHRHVSEDRSRAWLREYLTTTVCNKIVFM